MEYYIASPSKRRKTSRGYSLLVVQPEEDMSEIYDSLGNLRAEMEHRNKRLHQLQTEERELQTQLHKLEFRNRLRRDELTGLREETEAWEQKRLALENRKMTLIAESKQHLKDESKRLTTTYDDENNRLMMEAADVIEKTLSRIQRKEEDEKSALLNRCNELVSQVAQFDKESNQKMIKYKENAHKRLMGLRNEIDKRIKDLKQEIIHYDEVTRNKLKEQTMLEAEKSSIDSDTRILQQKLHTLTSKLAVKTENKALMETKLMQNSERNSAYRKTIPNISTVDELREKTNHIYQNDIQHAENIRKVKHNHLQDLKGTIRVYCRIKPPVVESESTEFHEEWLENGKHQLAIVRENEGSHTFQRNQQTHKYNFSFDRVFQATTSNEIIFEEISQLVQTAMDGFNVCIFAYGQTGSGKTHTMSLKSNGMIPLSLLKIFDDIEQAKLRGWEYKVDGEFVQIYNESIHDLIGPIRANAKCEIKHNEVDGTTSITNVSTVSLSSKSDALRYLAQADRNRTTAATKLNQNSSRSHSIYIFRITGKHNDEVILGTLNLIDLAGSERLASSQATGSRLRETQAINKSLSSLGDVIYNLSLQQKGAASQTQHIPYRNSKLTYLLKNSLGGTSKTLMFVNVSSETKDFNETLNSLRFAAKVNATKLGLDDKRK